jgi:iron complex transport system substrate-binding protein
VRVVTLLPAATEIVAALGDLRALVGISHECDYPPSVQHLPRVTASPVDVQASSASIDAEVRRLHESGQPVIAVDPAQLRRLAPDLIVTQDLCEVCAVSDGQVHRLASLLRPAPRVLSLQARDLQGIWRDIRAVGAALNLEEESEELVLRLQYQLKRLGSSRPGRAPRVLCIEWLEPLYLAGHWVPDLVAAAGGHDVGAQSGDHSARREWSEVVQLRPDHIFIMLCGFGVERARTELDRLTDPVAVELLRRVPTWFLDGNAYTSRPGPRVIDGAGLIHAAITDRFAPELRQWQPGEYAED